EHLVSVATRGLGPASPRRHAPLLLVRERQGAGRRHVPHPGRLRPLPEGEVLQRPGRRPERARHHQDEPQAAEVLFDAGLAHHPPPLPGRRRVRRSLLRRGAGPESRKGLRALPDDACQVALYQEPFLVARSFPKSCSHSQTQSDTPFSVAEAELYGCWFFFFFFFF
ncbi:hypothetical protein LY76DRAFT_662781, partial [Colletotrichum caudatum]